MRSTWSEAKKDDTEVYMHIQDRFFSNMGKLNAFGRGDLDSTSLSDSDLSDDLSRLRLSNNTPFDESSHEKELHDEILRRHRSFSSKIADDTRPHLAGNVYRTPRSDCLDVCSLPMYGGGVLYGQSSAIDAPNVSRMNHHHMKNVEHLSVAERLALMQVGNCHAEANHLCNTHMISTINPFNNRQSTITELDLAKNRKALLEDSFAQLFLQNSNPFLPKLGLSHNDNRLDHDEPCFPYSRMQRSRSSFHPKSGSIPCHGGQPPRFFSFGGRAANRNMGLQLYQDNAVANYHDSLDSANRSGLSSLDLVDVVGHVMDVSIDQHGSRFIQQKLEDASADERNKIFPEILSNAIALTTDVFGNYVIQKFFEFATESQINQLADQLKDHILELSFQMYGCRVVQKVLEVADMDRKINIVHELKNSVLKCIGDQNGNHVIQKCIESVPEDHISFVIEDILKQIFALCTHQYGCRVIQRVLEHCHDPATQSALMDEIVQHAYRLTEDKFGNYVVQHVLQHGKKEERSFIIQNLLGKMVILSQQKYASNVVEKCLSYGTPEERDSLIREIVSSGQTFQELMKDQFGNYVVQRVLQTCDEKFLDMILLRIKMHLNELRNYTYGKHIVARVEKLLITGEKRLVSKACQFHQLPNCTDVDANPI